MKTKLSLDNIDFRKGTQEDIKSLDSLRLKSMEDWEFEDWFLLVL